MKAKIVKESLKESSADFYRHRPFGNAPGQEDIDRQNLQKAEEFDTEEFWKDVAERMGGELDSFDLEEEGRIINIRMPDGEIMEIEQSWHYDGSPTKPVTHINGEDLGRFSIWDNPGEVADDYLEHYDRYANYRRHTDDDEIDESLNEGFATEEGRKLDRIASMLGYDDLHEMLGDNPGLYEACITWIDDTFAEQLGNEGYDPEELERLDLYQAADIAKDYQEPEDDLEDGDPDEERMMRR